MQKDVTIVIGGAGFIGKTLVDRLIIEDKNIIVVVDNLSNGKASHLDRHITNRKFFFIENDCSIFEECKNVFSYASNLGSIKDVWHLAANSDIPSGTVNPNIDLKDTFQTTFQIVNMIQLYKVERLFFASSSAIYGDCGGLAISETTGPLLPISNYGAMKLASEAIISAAAERSGFSAFLFRFPNVVGSPATHGVILDFCKKLLINPSILTVLGDGTQKKAYLHVSELVNAMIFLSNKSIPEKVYPVNIGPVDGGVTVRWIAESVVKSMSSTAKIKYGTEPRGWVGDVPKFNYSINKIRDLGWTPQLTSEEAINRAITEILDQLSN